MIGIETLCFNEIFIQMTVEFLNNFNRNFGQKPALPIIANRMYYISQLCSELYKTRSILLSIL